MITDRPTVVPVQIPDPMSPEPVAGDVVVAVGEDDVTSALRYAEAEAVARSAGVHLVHVVRIAGTDGADEEALWRAAVARGSGLLSTAADQSRVLGGGTLRLSCHLAQRGSVAGAISEQAELAGVVVLQHRHLGRLRRVVTHSVTRSVAARVDAPVVGVPQGWRPAAAGSGSIVVGVQDLDEAALLITRGFALATQRGLPLWVVHEGRRRGREASGIALVADSLGTRHPQVRMDLLIEEAPASRLLVNPMTAAEVVVLGRRHHLLPGTHLGSVARAVLDDAPCPVMLVRRPRRSRGLEQRDPS